MADEDFGKLSEEAQACYDLLGEAPIELDTGLANVIVVDNLPETEKADKLTSVIKKIFEQVCEFHDLHMPIDPVTKKTKGYCFLEFYQPEDADKAVHQTNGYKLDKTHVFQVNKVEDVERFANVSEEYVEPAVKPYEPRDHLKSWLTDSRARDQFVMRIGEDTEVHWNDVAIGQSEVVALRKNWTETYVQWSPKGTYLATFHRQGIAVWGGPNFAKLMRFSHPSVKFIEFSPSERFVVTWNNLEHDNPKDPQSLLIWDVRSGKKIRGFATAREGFSWPVFKWSHDDKFVARIGEDCIYVYETETFKMLDKKSVKVEGVKDFCWSPSDNIMSMWVPEQGNNPARITLMSFPDREEVRMKNLYNVSDVKMHWHPQGHFLCVKVDRLTKSRKSVYTNFELFRIRAKDVPIELLEMKEKEVVMAFSWEPRGKRFAIIHGEPPRIDVSFYTMGGEKAEQVKLVITLEKKQANHLFWSPRGGHIVLAGLKNMNGALEFYNVDECETMSQAEHCMCTDIVWDPTGRYVISSVSYWLHQMENGYQMWTFQGKMILRVPREKFYALYWRPRPETLLDHKAIQTVKKNLRDYSRRYEAEDEIMRRGQASDAMKQRQHLIDAFNEFMKKAKHHYEETKAARAEARGYPSDDEDQYVVTEETVEEVLDVKEELVASLNN